MTFATNTAPSKRAVTPQGEVDHPTRQRLLDAAETLFAQRGYHGVSLREVQKASGTSLNLIRYHVGSKDDLFRAVTGRRVQAMTDVLLDSLQRARQAQAAPLDVAQVVAVYLEAFGRLDASDSRWHQYLKLLIHSNSLVDRPELLSHLRERYQPVFDAFVAALEAAGMSHGDACWCVHMFIGCTAQMVVEVYSATLLSHDTSDAADRDAFRLRLHSFIVAGLEAFLPHAD